MGFFKGIANRLGGQPDTRAADVPSAAQSPSGEAVESGGLIYTRRTCPHCAEPLAKLPVRSMKCPACSEQIVRLRGDDELVYLVRDEAEATPLRAESEAYSALTRGIWQPGGGRWDPGAIRRHHRAWLTRYAALGVRVGVVVEDEPCGPCRTLAKTVFEPRLAPELPLAGCKRQYCFCRYEPVMGTSPPEQRGDGNKVVIEVRR